MRVSKIHLITENSGEPNVNFSNSTDDQFPYIESTLNNIDNNFKWWKENWEILEQLIKQHLDKVSSKSDIDISSRFTMFHGQDEKISDVIWTGPAIVYTLDGATPEVVEKVKNAFGGLFKGRKIFAVDNQLIFLFG